MRAGSLVLSLSWCLAGCGGSDFDVVTNDAAAEVDDTGGDAAAVVDTASGDTAGGDTPSGPADSGCKPLNECGGCKALEFPPTTSCGLCGSGKYLCDGKEATKCNDPIVTAPGTACGTCKTLKQVCSVDGLSTKCPSDDANACGGCKTLAVAPTTVCGVCGSGTYKCSGKDDTTCEDPVPSTATKLDTVCGICLASKFVCSAAKNNTECQKPDDRAAGVDGYDAERGATWDLSYGIKQRIAFQLKHKGAIHTLTFGVDKFPRSGVSSGGLGVTLYQGKPTDAAPTLVTSTTAEPATVPDCCGAAPVDVKLPAATSVYPAGTWFFVELSAGNPAYNFQTTGGATASPGEEFYLLSSGVWTLYAGYSPYLKVQMMGCF